MIHYDAIVVGGGINSLAVAALLAQEKKSILLLESRDALGGLSSTHEFASGFKCNMVYDYIRWIDPRLIKRLSLQKYGLKMISPDPLRIALDENGNHISFYSDPVKTAESISQHSTKDADNWHEFTAYIKKLTLFLEPLYKMTPPIISELGIKDLLPMSALLKPILKHDSRGLVDTIRSIPMMMPELLDEWFESKLLRGSLAASGIAHITQGPYSAATVLNFLHQHIHSNGQINNALFIKNGTGQFLQALCLSAKNKGVDIRTGTPVVSINCKSGVCLGVSTSKTQAYNSNIVISGLDPANTFTKLVGSSEISPTFKTQLNNIKYRGSTARIHFSLNKRPEITGIEWDQQNTIFAINPSIEYLERAYDDAKYGHISKNPYIEFSIPSLNCPGYAPSGKHVLSVSIQYLPYHLHNGTWNEKLKSQVIQNTILILEQYIPGFSNIIENSAIMTAPDLESSIGLKEGNLNHGEMTLDQFFFMRPNISAAQYSTPIKNLFLCGPGTHPGGGLHGSNAVNSVHEITKY